MSNKCYKKTIMINNCKPVSQSKYMVLETNKKKTTKCKKYYCHYKATGELVCQTDIIDIHDYKRKQNTINLEKQYKEISGNGIQQSQCLYDAFGNLVCDINSNY